ncbi:MAG: protein kinase [Planctomycetota bacterium]
MPQPPPQDHDDPTMPRRRPASRAARDVPDDMESTEPRRAGRNPGKGTGIHDALTATDRVQRPDLDAMPAPGVPSTRAPFDSGEITEPYSGDEAIAVTDKLGHYEVGGELGRGGMGIVSAAIDSRLGRRVAIKRLRNNLVSHDATSGFVHEAQITAQLEHPGIVPVHELGADVSGRPWLAMKHVSGRTLSEEIRRWSRESPRLSATLLREMISILDKVADAIAFAHDHGVIHRDLKPANVMVGRYGEVMVMDWGLARLLDDGRAGAQRRAATVVKTNRSENNDGRITMDGDVFGTPSYMAPEQADGRTADVDERTDVFALGAILYQMLTGEPPYTGNTVPIILGKALRRDVKAPNRRAPGRRIPRELSAIVMKAMAAKPANRYPTAQALKADLAAWLDYRPTTAYRPGPLVAASKWMRRHPVASAMAGLTLVFVSVLGAVIGVMQADAARTRAVQAEQTALEQEKTTRAREKAAAAEHAREQAELRSALTAGELDRVRALLKVEVVADRDKALLEFQHALSTHYAHQSQESFVAGLGKEKIASLVEAFDRLIAAHDQAPAQIPVSNDDYEQLGLLHFYGTLDLEAAVRNFTVVLQNDPDDKDSLIYRGLSLAKLGRFAEAERDFRRGLMLLPDDWHFYSAMGNLELGRNRGAAAAEWFTKSLDLDAGMPTTWTNRGIAWYQQREYDKAIADHSEALRLQPNFATAALNRGIAHYYAGHTAAAHEDVTRAIRDDPLLAGAFRLRALIRLDMRNWSGALEDCNESLKLEQTALAEYYRGQARVQLGDLRGGIVDLEAATKAGAGGADAWFDLGQARNQLGNFEGAVLAYNGAIEREPQWAEAIVNRGNAKRAAGHDLDALEDFRKAAAIKPGVWQAWFNQGIVLSALGRLEGADGARAMFDKALEVAPADQRDALRKSADEILSASKDGDGGR